jgi:hypothetical protein
LVDLVIPSDDPLIAVMAHQCEVVNAVEVYLDLNLVIQSRGATDANTSVEVAAVDVAAVDVAAVDAAVDVATIAETVPIRMPDQVYVFLSS